VEWLYEPSYEPPRTNRTATYEGSRTKVSYEGSQTKVSYEGSRTKDLRILRKSRTKELTKVSYEGPRTSSRLCKPQVTYTQGRRLGERAKQVSISWSRLGGKSTNQPTGKELLCQLKAVRHESA